MSDESKRALLAAKPEATAAHPAEYYAEVVCPTCGNKVTGTQAIPGTLSIGVCGDHRADVSAPFVKRGEAPPDAASAKRYVLAKRLHADSCAVPDAFHVDDARCTCGLRERVYEAMDRAEAPPPEPSAP